MSMGLFQRFEDVVILDGLRTPTRQLRGAAVP